LLRLRGNREDTIDTIKLDFRYGLSFELLVLENPDLGVLTPRPPTEGRDAPPRTPHRKVWIVGSVARFALASPVIDLL
jgi:hypothetical protein